MTIQNILNHILNPKKNNMYFNPKSSKIAVKQV